MRRRIAIIGGGSVGRALAGGFSRTGHDVVLGVRDPSRPDHQGDGWTTATPAAASSGADVVVLAVPVDALADVVPALELRPGQVAVDATNAVRTPVPAGFGTVGEFVGSLLPAGVHLVKAFDTIGAEHLGHGHVGDAAAFLPVAGDEAGRATVVELARGLGFDVADLGGREAIVHVEAHAALWIHLAFRCGWGREFGFSVARS